MNFEFFRGDDLDIVVKFMKGDVPQDITTWKVYLTLKKRIDDSDDDATLKKDNTVHINPTQGRTEFNLSAAETDVLVGLYHYDIQYRNNGAGAKIKTIIKGEFNFIKDVTRRIT